MNHRAIAILLALLVGVPLQATYAVSVISQSPYNIGIGFGPADVSPVGQGIPIFTQGDNMWVEDYYNFTVLVSLVQPNGTFATVQWLTVKEPTLLHTFSDHDAAGTWVLEFRDAYGSGSSVPVNVVGRNQTLNLDMANASLLGGGVLSLGFSVGRVDAYQIQACSVGADLPTAVRLGIPSSLGTGFMDLHRLGNNATLVLAGSASEDFTFWFEMYHSYSYTIGSGGEMVSRTLEVESVDPLSYGPNSTTALLTLPLHDQLPERSGRYTLRAFFRGPTGLFAQETSVLVTPTGGWVSLAGCTASVTTPGPSFSLSYVLTPTSADWPRGLFTMFTVRGVEGYEYQPIDLGLSAVSMVGTPWNVPLSDVNLRAVGTPIQSSSAVNGTVYILAGDYPVAGSILMDVGGRVYQNVSFSVPSPYSETTATVEVAKLVVSATSGGEPLAGASVAVAGPGGPGISKRANSTGDAVFFLPAGSYSASVTVVGGSQSVSVDLAPGKQTLASVELGGGQTPLPLYGLVAVGVLGVAANAWVWVRYFRRRIRAEETGLKGKQP